MKKVQVLKFWEELHDSTEKKQIIQKYENKSGYSGKRTLQRYTQVAAGLSNGQTIDEIARKTGWKSKRIQLLQGWWNTKFLKEQTIFKEKGEERVTSEYTNSNNETTTENKSTDICLASPEGLDVTVLEKWKIPADDAPEILRQWISYHKQGKHNLCVFFPKLKDDLVKGISIDKSNAILQMELRAEKFNDDKLRQVIDLARAIRPWQGRKNNEAAQKALKELYKPSKERLEHLNTISRMLLKFQDEIGMDLYNKKWEMTFDIEKDDLFYSIMDHYQDIAWCFDQFRVQRFKYERMINEFISSKGLDSSCEFSQQFNITAVLSMIFFTLKLSILEYSIKSDGNHSFYLITGNNNIIARGSEVDVIKRKEDHCQLINNHIEDPAIRQLVVQRRRVIDRLKPLYKQIQKTLSNKDENYSFCLKCPR
jgi:hypothetical protein